ncbi:MAG: hypothetical protein AUJ98_08265 [Bacteroidetes bacterium CG2_30_33_31]|nr:MAG: hypothetical protein AUJ98_08265 [Bacteroidetes bacterium CG2_30_33_31]
MKFFKRIWPILYNKYFVVIFVFFVYILIFDNNNLIFQYRLISQLNSLQNQKDFYLTEIKKDNESINVLLTNKRNLERFGREKYLMKRDNEDIYLFIHENKEE